MIARLQHAARRAALGIVVSLGIVAGLCAQTPRLIHYQGRLTDAQNHPITTVTSVYFSIYSGGTAGVANQTTELYREVASITPDVNGIFNHDIGSTSTATIQLGSLTGALFNTAQPLFVQVAIGSVGNVMLPRAQITTVGYAFVAGNATGDITPHSVAIPAFGTVINSSGQWVGPAISGGGGGSGVAGAPAVTSLTDTTGGNVVVGDTLQIGGAGLATAAVTVGDKTAPIISESGTQVTFQVPAGVPPGLNDVRVTASAAGVAATYVSQINVHRYAIAICPGNATSVFVIDPALAPASQIVAQLNPGITYSTSFLPMDIAFVNQGGVAILPNNSNGQIRAIDLTANPPALIGSSTFNTGAVNAQYVAASPDGKTVTVADTGNAGMRVVPVAQAAPPYSNSFFGAASTINLSTGSGLATYNGSAVSLSGFATPHGMAFVNDSTFLITAGGSNEVASLIRTPGTNTFTFNPNSSVSITDRVAISGKPYAVRVMPDHTRAVVSTENDIQTVYLAPSGFSLNSTFVSGVGTLAPPSLSPDNKMGFQADPTIGSTAIHAYYWNGQTASFVGDGAPLPTQTFHYNTVAVEPARGKTMIVGTDALRLEVYALDGATYTLLNALNTQTAGRPTLALAFQP